MSSDQHKTNPYESPTALNREFSENSRSDLEHRVAELERRMSKSWFLRQNFFIRTFAVWGHFIIGYLILLVIAFPFILLIEWLVP